jgi:single-stranded-DNA-specific exonuclease
VRMVDHLSGMFAVVHRDVDAVGADRLFDRYREYAYGFGDCRPVVGLNIKNIRRVFFWHDERMARIHRTDVEKANGLVIFVYLERGQLTADDLAEKAVGIHTRYRTLVFRGGTITFVNDNSQLVHTLLARRGITAELDIAAFLNPDYDLHTYDPFLLAGMERATERFLRAIEENERIAVYADFDCDGIPGAALLFDLFEKISYKNFEIYLPHRDREGYGFHTQAIEELAARGVKLIVTVDVGTTAAAAVQFAKEHSVETIVTDHHEIMNGLPDAVAVLNPKIAPYPFPDLCGAGVAFKFAQAILAAGKKKGLENFVQVPDGWEKWLLDMVAIATVADMVPIIGENRALVHWGLKVLQRSKRPGIDALCAAIRIRKNELTEDDIGFSLAPRINAASRMDHPDLALKLLTTRDPAEAQMLAAQLEKLNASRKGVVGGIVREAKKHVRTRFVESDRVIVLGNPEWKPALLGLAANSIMAERGGVVCLWGRDVNGNLKGSCRSDGGVSIVDLFANSGDVFQEYGGHAKSGGFSVSHERVHALPEVLKEAARATSPAAQENTVREADAHLSLPEISRPLFVEVSRLAPFGIGNPKPTFLVGGAIIIGVKRFGKESAHIEVMLEDRHSGKTLRAFDFFRSPDNFSIAPSAGNPADVLATIERDSFRGGLALRIVDIVAPA